MLDRSIGLNDFEESIVIFDQVSERVTAARKTVANTEKMKNGLLFFKDKFMKGEGIPTSTTGDTTNDTNQEQKKPSRIPIRSPQSLIHAHLCENNILV